MKNTFVSRNIIFECCKSRKLDELCALIICHQKEHANDYVSFNLNMFSHVLGTSRYKGKELFEKLKKTNYLIFDEQGKYKLKITFKLDCDGIHYYKFNHFNSIYEIKNFIRQKNLTDFIHFQSKKHFKTSFNFIPISSEKLSILLGTSQSNTKSIVTKFQENQLIESKIIHNEKHKFSKITAFKIK